MADNARSGSFAQRHRVRRALCLRTPYVPAWQHLRIRSRRSIERKKNRLSFHWRHGSKSAGSTHFFFGPAKQVCHRPSNCAARQDTYVLTADNILKTKHGLQDTQILLTKTKMPTSLVQEGWRKLFGWRLLNHRLGRSFGRHWLDLVTLQGLVRCLHLLFVDLNVWCLDTKNPFRQQSDLSSTFGRRPDEQARFPIRHLKLQNPWYRGDSFHSKRCLWTKNGRDPSIPHPRRTVCLRVLHLCLLRGLGKDGHILAHHIGFRKNQPKCRVFQIHIQVRHRYDAAACAVALSTQVWRPKRNGERNKFGNMFQLEEHENSQTKRKHTERKQTHRQKHKKRKHTDRKHTKKIGKKTHTEEENTQTENTQTENTKRKHTEGKTQREHTQTENTDRKHTDRKHRQKTHREKTQREKTQREKTQRKHRENTETSNNQPHHHHKNTTTPPQKHNRITKTLPHHHLKNVHLTTVLSIQHPRSDERTFYHSFEHPTISFCAKGRRAKWEICVLPQFCAFDNHFLR